MKAVMEGCPGRTDDAAPSGCGWAVRMGVAVATILVVPACGGGRQAVERAGPPATPTAVSAPTVDSVTADDDVAPAGDTPDLTESLLEGTAIAFRLLTLDELDTEPEVPSGSLELRGCRWRLPGLYSFDLRFEPDESQDYPIDVVVSPSLYRGDQGIGWRGVARLAGPGDFSVPYDDYAVMGMLRSGSGDGAAADRSTLDVEQRVECEARLPGDDLGGFVTAAATVEPLALPPADAGTLEGLAATVAVDDGEANLLPLPSFVRQLDPLVVDRVYVSPSGRLEQIALSERGNCVLVRSSYEVAPDTSVQVSQGLRCQGAPTEAVPGISVADDVWTVTVRGPEEPAAAVAADLRGFPLAEAEPFDGAEAAFDPDAAIEAELAESGTIELARVPWRDGLVSVVSSGDGFSVERYADPIVALPEPFSGGSGGTGCIDWAISSHGDAGFGFHLVVVEDRANSVTVSSPAGDEPMIEMTPALGGRAVAVIDQSEVPGRSSFTVRDPSGAPIPCRQ